MRKDIKRSMFDFADNLKEARRRRKMTQQQVADKTGLKPVAISLFETGRRKPNLVNLRNLCKALVVSSDELLGLKPHLDSRREAALSVALQFQKLLQSEIEQRDEN